MAYDYDRTDAPLRKAIIRLAHAKPELREHLLPLIKKVARGPDPRGRAWTEKSNPHRWVWSGSSGDPAFTVTEHEASFGTYYKLQLLLPDGSMYKAFGQNSDPSHWFQRAANLYSKWGKGGAFDLSKEPDRWSKMAARPPEWDRKPQMAPAPWERVRSDGGPKMGKFTNEQAARRHARKHDLFYGFSPLGGGGWYAGNSTQLAKIGVSDPQKA